MKKKTVFVLPVTLGMIGLGVVSLGRSAEAVADGPTLAPATPKVAISRLYNPNTGEHLFTPSNYERAALIDFGWQDEGSAFKMPDYAPGASMDNYVHRIYNPNAGDHHYLTNVGELENLLALGWHDDNVGFYAANDGQPVYRLYNPNAKAGAHHFTLSAGEKDALIKAGWHDEGVGFKAYAD